MSDRTADTSETLHEQPERDHFKHESPIRAFTTWSVEGLYAIGKGFRPSLQHLVPYLNAMESKEGWRLLQVLEAATGSPSFVFRADTPPMYTVNLGAPFVRAEAPCDHNWLELTENLTGKVIDYRCGLCGIRKEVTSDNPADVLESIAEQMVDGETIKGVDRESFDAARAFTDDPINPKHYGGRECADIGERLSANGYQVLKYCWRLGKKDDPCQELDKALWYLDSEADLIRHLAQNRGWCARRPNVTGIRNPVEYLEKRIAEQPLFTQAIARFLWAGYGQRELDIIRDRVESEKIRLECGSGLAI